MLQFSLHYEAHMALLMEQDQMQGRKYISQIDLTHFYSKCHPKVMHATLLVILLAALIIRLRYLN